MSEELYRQVKQAAADGGLDDLVHDVASALATTVNNSSLPKQMLWLYDHGVSYEEMLKYLEDK
jgi:hypothetical protein